MGVEFDMKAKGTRPINTHSHERMKRDVKHKQTTPPGHSFEPNAFYEKVLALRRNNARAFDSLAPVKQALYAYETAKREHSRLAAIRDEPEAG